MFAAVVGNRNLINSFINHFYTLKRREGEGNLDSNQFKPFTSTVHGYVKDVKPSDASTERDIFALLNQRNPPWENVEKLGDTYCVDRCVKLQRERRDAAQSVASKVSKRKTKYGN